MSQSDHLAGFCNEFVTDPRAETIQNRPCGVLLPISTASNVVAGPVSIAANDTSQVIGMTLHVSSATEMGQLEAGSGEVAVVPRDVRFRATRPDDDARDLSCRNHAAMLRLPDLDPTGAKGLANARDFRAPAVGVGIARTRPSRSSS